MNRSPLHRLVTVVSRCLGVFPEPLVVRALQFPGSQPRQHA